MDIPPLGTRVTIPQGEGAVRFAGTTSFSAGKWVGIELDQPNGKNDGSVHGIRYFTCEMGYGVFIRPSQIKAILGSEMDHIVAPVARLVGGGSGSSSGHQRTPSTGSNLLRNNSFRSPAIPSSVSSPRSQSPAKPTPTSSPVIPAARLPRALQPSPMKPVVSTPAPASKLTLQQPRKSISLRQSPTDPPVPPSPSPRGASSALPKPAMPATPAVTNMPRTASPLTLSPQATTPPPLPALKMAPLHQPVSQPLVPDPLSVEPPTPVRQPSRSSTPEVIPQRSRPEDEQEIQELRAKIRVLETRRADDARHVRELETRLAEAEAFVALRPKLQAKLNSQQTELLDTRRELADAQQLAQLNSNRMLDMQEQLELAMLDKEVAEERAENAEAQLEEEKERAANLEVELNVLKSGGDVNGTAGGSGKDTLAYMQLEKQNERLKEALIRLRDISQETEQEQRRRIAEMEKDIANFDELQAQHESTLIMLSNADNQVEELKRQLDDALSAEDLLVQLTERNLELSEKLEEMRINVEDLEALKELSDEIEETHLETEKALRDDIEQRDTTIKEQSQKIETLEEACLDLDGTINQFRELVLQLQGELDNLRTQTQTAQNESATAASQTAAVMSLNIKLQSSASKNQARNVELEIKKIEARERKELLEILQPYLPQAYVETDSDATSCYLFFQRIALKLDVISSIEAQIHNLPDALNGPGSETLVGVCDLRARLASLSSLCKRFSGILRRCDVDSFLNIGRVYPEIAPLEKRLDMHLDLLRRDEFRESECHIDVENLQKQFDHLAEAYFDGFDVDLGERELRYTAAFDGDLDIFAASVLLIKTSIENLLKDEEVNRNLNGYEIEPELYDPLQRLLDLYKSAKNHAKKLSKRLEDLTSGEMALKSTLMPSMKSLSDNVAQLANFGITTAQKVMLHLQDVRSLKGPFQLTFVLSSVKETATTTAIKDLKPGSSVWDALNDYIIQLSQEASRLVPLSMENDSILKMSRVAPWVTRVEEIKATLAINVEAERKVSQLNEEIQGLVRTLKIKDQNIQESSVKIELMERRMETVKKQADEISQLKVDLDNARGQVKEFEDAIEHLQVEADALMQDNAKLKAANAGQERQAGAQPVEAEHIQIEGNYETSYLLEQIDALRGTVRFLRSENSYLKGQDLLREIESLPPLPSYQRTISPPLPPTKPPGLDPSGLSDTEESSSDSGTDILTSRTPPTLHSIALETKLLYRDVIQFSATPKVVDLSALNEKRREAKNGKVWMPRKKMPAHQVWERKMEAERLNKRVKGLIDRAAALGLS
ncbi:hypothetical protein AX16_008593 [Volvariella volvacea WC 439]|nr:hypothetical protein AX16_008593 [Volvariella volvacea WC 439]